MAQSGFTPLLIYSSSTATNVPSASNLLNNTIGAELAINITDGKLYYKDNAGVVQILASRLSTSTTISFGTTGLTPNTATSGAITVAGILITSSGGTGLSSYTAGDLPYYATGTALSKLGIGTSGQILTSSGTFPQWSTLSGVAVTSFQTSLSGLTPTTATNGAVTLAGTLGVASGGTGLTTLTAGYIPYGNGTSAFSSSSNLNFNGTNLGLGVTPSAWSGVKAIDFNTGGGLAGDAANYYLTSNAYYNGTNWIYKGTNYATQFNTSNGNFIWNNAPSGTAGTAITYTQAMTLDATGNLGIGTTSFSNKLTVVTSGTSLAAFQGAQYSQIRHSDGTRVLYTQVYSNEARLFTETSTPLLFGTNNLESMRLDSSGNLLIGASVNGSTNSRLRTVQATGSNSAFEATANDASYAGTVIYSTTTRASSASFDFFGAYANGVLQHQLRGDGLAYFAGNVGIGTTSPSSKLVVSGSTGTTQILLVDSTASINLILGVNASTVDIKGVNGVPMAFYTANTERMRIDNVGNLLLGTTTNIYPSTGRTVLNINGTSQSLFGMQVGGVAKAYILHDGTDQSFYNQANGSQIFGTNNTEQMRILNNGNLGVGTNNPLAKINASGTYPLASCSIRTTNLSANGFSSYEFAEGTTVQAQIWAGNSTYASFGGVSSLNYSANGGPHVWYVNYVEFMRLNATGLLGIGVTPITGAGILQVAAGNLIGCQGDNFNMSSASKYVSGWKYTVTGTPALRYEQLAGAHTWYNAPSGTINNAITFTQAMTLDASGNLTLGSPSAVKLNWSNIGNYLNWIECGGTASSNYMRFATGNAEAMRIDNLGNLGVGVTPNAWGTAVRAIQLNQGAFAGYSSGANLQTWVYNNLYFDGSVSKYITSNYGTLYAQYAGQHIFYNAPSGTAGATATTTQAMTLDASGNLMLGTATSYGKFIISNGGAEGIEFYPQYTTGVSQLQTYNRSGTAFTSLRLSSLDFVFFANGTEAMRLNSSGNLGLGVTPSAWDTTYKAIQLSAGGFIASPTGAYAAYIGNNAYYNGGWKYLASTASSLYYNQTGLHYWYTAPSGTAGTAITYTQAMTLNDLGFLLIGRTAVTSGYASSINSTANGTTNYGHNIQNSSATLTTFETFTNNSGVIAGSITQATSTSVAFNTTSDQRLKTNIVDAPLGNIDQIKVRSFDWVTDGSHQEYGMVAQELVEVAPYAVHQPINPDEMMAVDYSKLVPMMIKEIQDLKQRINTLEKR